VIARRTHKSAGSVSEDQKFCNEGKGKRKHLSTKATARFAIQHRQEGEAAAQCVGNRLLKSEKFLGQDTDSQAKHTSWRVLQKKKTALQSTSCQGPKREPQVSLQSPLAPLLQLKLDSGEIENFAGLVGISPSAFSVAEVPKNKLKEKKDFARVDTKFKDYGQDHLYNIGKLKKESYESAANGEYETYLGKKPTATEALSLAGGAAYIATHSLCLIDEQLEEEKGKKQAKGEKDKGWIDGNFGYSRLLLHEIGHAAQHHKEDTQATSENTTVLLLEWHNILKHENKHDPKKLRVRYNNDASRGHADAYEKAKDNEEKENALKKLENAIKIEYGIMKEIAGRLFKENGVGKEKDRKLYREVYDQVNKILEERGGIEAMSLSDRFEHRRMQLNILVDLQNIASE